MSDETATALYQRMFNGLASLQTMGEHDKELFRLVYIQEIARALHAERVKVWEEAAKYWTEQLVLVDDLEPSMTRLGMKVTHRAVIDYCRAKANGELDESK